MSQPALRYRTDWRGRMILQVSYSDAINGAGVEIVQRWRDARMTDFPNGIAIYSLDSSKLGAKP